MLTQLVYTSRPRFSISDPEGRKVLDDISAAARKHNAGAGISGVLLAGEDWISQILEGETAALTPILKRILADPRHENVQIVEMRKIPEPRFEGWSMAVSNKQLQELPISRLGDFTAEDLVRLASAAKT